jgi:hypothetical protein
MKMGQQTVSTLHAICKHACRVITEEQTVLSQVMTMIMKIFFYFLL